MYFPQIRKNVKTATNRENGGGILSVPDPWARKRTLCTRLMRLHVFVFMEIPCGPLPFILGGAGKLQGRKRRRAHLNQVQLVRVCGLGHEPVDVVPDFCEEAVTHPRYC